MFLLIQGIRPDSDASMYIFTFHNVSINTAAHDVDKMLMTLFTFHNVSINTEIMELRHLDMKDFTFHNVSINTKKQVLN